MNAASGVARLNYVELTTSDLAATRDFFASVFGWDIKTFGPSYAATVTGLTGFVLS